MIIGAGISRAGALFLDTVKRTVKARALHTASTSVDIKLSELGDTVAAQGAAILVLKDTFKSVRKSLLRETRPKVCLSCE